MWYFPSYYSFHFTVSYIFINKFVRAISIEATPLCLLPNKLYLFILTQHMFILIQFGTCICVLHVSVCTGVMIRHGVLQKSCKGLCKIFVLTCLRMASIQDESRKHTWKGTNWLKINLCCFRTNKCNLSVHTIDVVATKYKVIFYFEWLYTLLLFTRSILTKQRLLNEQKNYSPFNIF
jgi:hypothetical protein